MIKDIVKSIKKIKKDKRNLLVNKPELIIFDITHRCNINCDICDIRKDKPIKEFTTEEIIDIISQAIRWNVPDFVLSGGEPLLRKDVFKILDFVKQKDYSIGILTNGTLLNKDMLSKLQPYLVSGSLSLTISLDAISPRIHDKIRGCKEVFAKTIAAFKILSNMKINHPDINYNSITIVLNDNLEELLSLLNLLKEFKVNSIQLQSFLPNNLKLNKRKTKSSYWVQSERFHLLDSTIDKIIEFKKNNPNLLVNSIDNLQLMKKYFRDELCERDVSCSAATKTMLISREGHVVACNMSYGNIKNSKLEDIWYSKDAKKVRLHVKKCKKPCLLPCFTDNQDENKRSF